MTKVLTPMERDALLVRVIQDEAEIVYAREEKGVVYMTVKMHRPLFPELRLEKLQ